MPKTKKKFEREIFHHASIKDKSLDDKINEGHFYIGRPKDWNKNTGR